MGIKVEFNPDLALRNISEFKNSNRSIDECVPEKLVEGEVHTFLKEGQRNYWLEGEIPLLETNGSQLSKPIASIIILESTHFVKDKKLYTKGKYKIIEVFRDDKIRFNAFSKV